MHNPKLPNIQMVLLPTVNETFNNIPEVKEISDEDTIVYTSGSNGKPLLAWIEKEFNLNQVIRKFYRQDKIYSKILENPKSTC